MLISGSKLTVDKERVTAALRTDQMIPLLYNRGGCKIYCNVFEMEGNYVTFLRILDCIFIFRIALKMEPAR